MNNRNDLGEVEADAGVSEEQLPNLNLSQVP